MPRQTEIKFRRGTAALWSSTNPVLSAGEPGIETDTDKVKYGDGVTAWNSLNYATGGGGVAIGTTAPTDTEATPLWWDSSTATMYIYYDGAWVEASAAVAGPQGPQGEQGLQGVQGTSGVISVTSPITNSGTTSEAVLGLDQSALTIAQSQVTNLTTDLAGKAATSHTHAQSDITNLSTDLAAKAPLANPVFTGTVEAGGWTRINRPTGTGNAGLEFTSPGQYGAFLYYTPGVNTLMVSTLATGATDTGANKSLRNIFINTTDPSGGSDGDVWMKYTP